MSTIENDRRNAVDTYFRLLQHHADFVERTQETFSQIESHLFQIINLYNEDINRRTSYNNSRNIFNNGSFGNRSRSSVGSTPLFNESGASRRRTPAFTPSQNILDTITLWALFPNGIANNNNLESLSPVVVRPTNAQINEATENMFFHEVIDPGNRSCPINQEEFQNDDEVSVIRHCGHIFRRSDLSTWFRTNVRCPLCRYDIREYRRGAGGAISRQNSVRNMNPSSPITNNGARSELYNDISDDEDNANASVGLDANAGAGLDANAGAGPDVNAGAGLDVNASAGSDANASAGLDVNASAGLDANVNEVNNPPFPSNNIFQASSGQQLLELINQNISRVMETSDISDNINVNFEFAYIHPHDLSNNQT